MGSLYKRALGSQPHLHVSPTQWIETACGFYVQKDNISRRGIKTQIQKYIPVYETVTGFMLNHIICNNSSGGNFSPVVYCAKEQQSPCIYMHDQHCGFVTHHSIMAGRSTALLLFHHLLVTSKSAGTRQFGSYNCWYWRLVLTDVFSF